MKIWLSEEQAMLDMLMFTNIYIPFILDTEELHFPVFFVAPIWPGNQIPADEMWAEVK